MDSVTFRVVCRQGRILNADRSQSVRCSCGVPGLLSRRLRGLAQIRFVLLSAVICEICGKMGHIFLKEEFPMRQPRVSLPGG